MSTKIYKERLSQLYNSGILAWIIICIGIALRLARYLHNPSLWFDESVLATDIINRSFSELILPSSDWSSKQPYGFLILEKLAIQAFGYSEYAFRLFPLLFGTISVPLFYKLAKHFIKREAVPIALGLFAILDPLIYQSSNIKPYSGDMAFALIIFICMIHIQSKNINLPRVLFMGMLGAVIIWFSHPSVFVLSGVGTCLILLYASKKQWAALGKLSIAFTMWAVSFIVFYFVYTRHLIEGIGFSTNLMLQYENALMPFPPKSLADIRWYIDNFFDVFTFTLSLNYPAGLPFNGLAASAFLVGCISMFHNKKQSLFIILSPILFTLLAAILHKYPFKGRLIMFLVPFVILLIAEGIEFIREKISVYSATAGLVVIGVLFIYPVSWAAYHAVKPSSPEEIRPVIRYIKENWQNGDIIYVHYYPQYAFEYYTKYHPNRYSFDEKDYIIGIAPRGWYRTWRKQKISDYYSDGDTTLQSNTEILKEYVNDLNKLKGRKRVWVLFSSVIYKDNMREENFYLFQLDTIGKRLDSFGRPGIAAVYLYDLSEKTSSQ